MNKNKQEMLALVINLSEFPLHAHANRFSSFAINCLASFSTLAGDGFSKHSASPDPAYI